MRWIVRGGGEAREVEVERNGDHFEVEIDGRRRPVELERLDLGVASGIVFPGEVASNNKYAATVRLPERHCNHLH